MSFNFIMHRPNQCLLVFSVWHVACGMQICIYVYFMTGFALISLTPTRKTAKQVEISISIVMLISLKTSDCRGTENKQKKDDTKISVATYARNIRAYYFNCMGFEVHLSLLCSQKAERKIVPVPKLWLFSLVKQ